MSVVPELSFVGCWEVLLCRSKDWFGGFGRIVDARIFTYVREETIDEQEQQRESKLAAGLQEGK